MPVSGRVPESNGSACAQRTSNSVPPRRQEQVSLAKLTTSLSGDVDASLWV
jgi:hypothetical protein